MADAHLVILFDSIHHVLAAERVFKEQGVWCDVVPTPRDLSSDCGMAVETREADLAAVRQVLASPRVRPRGIYRPGDAGHVLEEQLTTELTGGEAP
jgi:hypothetical protein